MSATGAPAAIHTCVPSTAGGNGSAPPRSAAAHRCCRPASSSRSASATQREVSATLRSLGWAHEEECDIGGLLVDMADVAGRVVVEFDGPTHYITDLATGEEREDGPTVWKTRLLERLGYRVVRIGHVEWNGGGWGYRNSEEEHRKIARNSMRLAGVNLCD